VVRSVQKSGFESLLIRSPAKVNLRLEVLSRRRDGFHNIRTAMVPIDLVDVLDMGLTDDETIRVTCSRDDLPVDERNLVYRAAAVLLKITGRQTGVRIDITKRIPVGAGLGGGSSNAAATLCGINRLLAFPLKRTDLLKLAPELGADVPFFVYGRPAVATGVGERLEPLTGLPRLWFVLVYPGFGVSTRWAYERVNLWLTKINNHISMSAFPYDISNLGEFLANDLEKGVEEEYPVLRWIKNRLLAVGSAASLMSGSGSTVFGLFLGRERAEQAYHQVKQEFEGRGWDVFLARSIAH
jgi:4-diphosphocytidyl-2-C-methyl-D-erythritol kinase